MPSPPPREESGKIVPHNHPDIHDDHHVIRHIVPPHDLHPDPTTNVTRVSSGAYSESGGGGMSVDILEWMIADGLYDLYYLSDDTEGATSLRVGDLRDLGLMVGWDPDGGHPQHGAVWGIANSSKRRRIAKLAVTIKKADGET
jgi:hypothetical protein